MITCPVPEPSCAFKDPSESDRVTVAWLPLLAAVLGKLAALGGLKISLKLHLKY